MTAESDLSTISRNGSGSADYDVDGHSGNGDVGGGGDGDGGSDDGDGGGMGTRSHMGGRINKNKKNDTRLVTLAAIVLWHNNACFRGC
ncbi:hypothetical protein V1477_005881 [Vespula maculifrons]|uniref:Uncharacterized protein n=1 Tax=Vespula maculifrons TaxID=7453 RepID=A0ABD2CLJ1_VESMC